MLAELIEQPDVVEELVIRSRFGFMAYHGGTLERVTDSIAREAAEASGSSYYGVVQGDDDPIHIPSTEVSPEQSTSLSRFLSHVDVVITIHGYGRDRLAREVLLGGRNRELARHVAVPARQALPGYTFQTDLDKIPRALVGQHARNPVNRPPRQGVQVELPPTMRWHHERRGWSDHGDIGRAPQVDTLITVLAAAATSWPLDSPR